MLSTTKIDPTSFDNGGCRVRSLQPRETQRIEIESILKRLTRMFAVVREECCEQTVDSDIVCHVRLILCAPLDDVEAVAKHPGIRVAAFSRNKTEVTASIEV